MLRLVRRSRVMPKFAMPGGFAAAMIVGAGLLLPRAALAESTDPALAESLFREGKRLMSKNRFAEACPKFAESFRLDPGLGTLLNLAACNEAEGKIASAWAHYSEALARAKRQGDADRAEFAEERVNALEPKLPWLSVSISEQAKVPGLVVKLDGRELNSAVFGIPVPVDPGEHRIEASAPGKQTWAQTIKAKAQAPVVALTIPALQDATVGTPPATSVAEPVTPQAAPGTNIPRTQPKAQPTEPERGNKAALWAGVATGAMAVGAIATGVLYSKQRSEFEKSNDGLEPGRFDDRDSAQTLGIVNLALVGATAVAGGITIYLLASPESSDDAKPPTAAALQIIPVVAPGAGALSIRGRL